MKRITKTVEVNVDEYFDVNITLSMDEIKQFFDSCSNEEKAEISNVLGIRTYQTFFGDSIIDVMKSELVTEACSKYTLEQLEQRLK